MKKLIEKIKAKKSGTASEAPSRITSDTVAEHREKILAGGRRFKYPLQYVRHKLVFNAIIISLVAIVSLLLLGWWQLYPMQNTSEFIYKITKVLPLPVASVDGQAVLYSDYLMKYLSSVHYLEQKEQVSLKTADGKRQVSYIKQQSMGDAIADAYAEKLASQMKISVNDEEVEAFIKAQRQSSDGETSEQTYFTVIQDFYGWSPSEYRHVVMRKLLRQKVAFAVDDASSRAINNIHTDVANGSTNFKQYVDSLTTNSSKTISYGVSGWVPSNNQDGGLAMAASKMTKNQVSGVIKSTLGDGYYVIRLLDTKDGKVSYEYILVSLSTFNQRLSSVKNKTFEYITIPKN
ncbi:hypothetical protein HGB24_00440 [Candidatus Saccharibacteria bacterium]|nr:hypothetical protein [Candidatus Saccharibacteria bacterium]